jgi:hypothetical protein
MLQMKKRYEPGCSICSIIEQETTGSSHEGVMILPVLTVSSLPNQVYVQTDVRTTSHLAEIAIT